MATTEDHCELCGDGLIQMHGGDCEGITCADGKHRFCVCAVPEGDNPERYTEGGTLDDGYCPLCAFTEISHAESIKVLEKLAGTKLRKISKWAVAKFENHKAFKAWLNETEKKKKTADPGDAKEPDAKRRKTAEKK